MRHREAMLKTTLRITLLVLMVGGLLVATPCWSQETYKIGGIFSVTGAQSFLGDPEKKSLEMVVDAINAKGGIDGHRLEAIIYDDEGDPTKAVNAATRLISKDNVLAIIGPSAHPDHAGHHPGGRGGEGPPDQLCGRHQNHRTGKTLGIQDRAKRRTGRGRHL